MSEKVLITLETENDPNFPASVIAGYNHLMKKIGTECRVFTLKGLSDAVSRLPTPHAAVINYRFQLVPPPPKSSDMNWCKKQIDKILSENIDLQSVIDDALQMLAIEEYRVFYDSNIAKAIDCCTEIIAFNFDRLKLYRHMQLFMKLLEKDNILHLCVYSFNIEKFYQTMRQNLTDTEQNVLNSFFGLNDGIPHHLSEISHNLYPDLQTIDVIRNLSKAIRFLRERQNEFISQKFSQKANFQQE